MYAYRRFRDRLDDDQLKIVIRVCGVIILAALGIYYWMIRYSLFSKLWLVTWSNWPFPIVLILLGGWSAYWKWRENDEFSWGELLLYCVMLPPIAYPFTAGAYFFLTDLHDIEVWNGYVTEAQYYEAWTEKHTSTDKDGHTTTTYIYHPPEWQLLTNNVLGTGEAETVSVNTGVYRQFVSLFGNEKLKLLVHFNQSSVGDGNMYYSKWNRQEVTKIPTAVEHPFVNYLRASHSIMKTRGAMSGFQNFLLPYPRVHGGTHGKIELDRVLCSGASASPAWCTEVSRLFNRELMELGKRKEVNLLMYIVGTGDINFRHALHEYWDGGKQNDVIVIIGVPSFPQIAWVDVIAWTDHELFKETLKDRVLALKSLDNSEALVSAIVNQTQASGEEGFKRKPMEDYQYLVAEIRLPIWATLLLIIVVLGLTVPFLFFFCNN